MMVDNGGGQLAWQLDRIAVKNEITTWPHGVSEFQSDDDDEWKKGFFRLSVLTNQSRHHDISTLCNLFYLMIRRKHCVRGSSRPANDKSNRNQSADRTQS